MKEDIMREIELPNGVTAVMENGFLKVKGPKGEVSRNFTNPKILITLETNKIIFNVFKGTKREKAVICSFVAHTKNMISGVKEPHVYKLKICSGHFPMNVSISNGEIVIKNFLGESVPRKASLFSGIEIKINGTEILITSPNKELAGQMAARIEKMCVISNRDRRIFQDGCYITHKAGTEIK